ncbi:MAG: hypothetical protein ABI629_10940 [bacterium]
MAKPPPCEESAERHARAISGEVAGEHSFGAPIGDWTFILLPQKGGWLLSLNSRDGRDLTAVTPPFHAPNPRELYGWHFRNADNTAANDGSVNAPQLLRLFQFAPAIEGTGGFTAPADDALVEADGRGWLHVDDMGLADLEPGAQARMVYLRFRACLTWPRSAAEISAASARGSTRFTPEEIEIFAACGLKSPYELNAWITPRRFGGDFDGDGSLDSVATVVRRSDGKRGLAVCRAGTYLHLLGFDAPIDDLAPGYFAQVEAWTAKPRSQVIDYQDSPPLADFDRDVISVERVEKSSYTIYWDNGAFRARRDYRLVTE